MISWIIFFLQLSYSHLPVNGECTCFYYMSDNKTRCNTTCKQQLVEVDQLYFCPSKQFQQILPFWRWILAEIFCIKKDNRDDVIENYQPSSTANYDTPSSLASNESPTTRGISLLSSNESSTKTPDEISYGSSILIYNTDSDLNIAFSYPAVSFSSSLCGKMKKAEFMIPSSSTCYYRNGTASIDIINNFIEQLSDNSTFIASSDVQFNVRFSGEDSSPPENDDILNGTDTDTNYTDINSTIEANCTDVNCTDEDNYTDANSTESANYADDNTNSGNHASLLSESIEDKFVSSIDVIFYIDNAVITGANVTISQTPLKNLIDLPLTINIDYINTGQYQNQNRISMKSGNFGYAFGQPVIALQQGSPQEEPFPVPYGIDGNDSYTPLLFGVDVISGFIDENLTFLQHDFKISKLGQGNPEFINDWINVTVSEGNPNIKVFTLKIYYANIGNVNNPQNMIVNAYLYKPSAPSNTLSGQCILKCNFLKIANNPSHQYLQPNPRVKGIPPDTFYPFSSDDDL